VKKVFIAVLLIPILVVGGLKGALWYFTKSAMDDLKKNVAAFVDLRYGGIETSLQGSVIVNNVALYSSLIDDTVKINSLKLKTNDLLSLLTLQSKLNKNQLPDSMLIHIQGVEMDMGGNIAETFLNPETPPNVADQISTLACGNTNRFDVKAMQNMGYQSMLADFIIQYQYDESRSAINLTLIENLDRLFSMKVTTSIGNINRIPSINSLTNMPRLGKVNISYDDDSVTSRKVKYCAKQNASTETEYIEKHVRLFDQFIQQMGIGLGPELLGAYKETLLKPGSIDLSFDLSGIEDFNELTQIPIADLIHNISTELNVNNKPVKLHGLKINQDKFMQAALGQRSQKIEVEDPNVEPEKPPKTFHPVKISKLAQYKNYQVIIKTRKGKTYQGRLEVTDSHRYKYAVATRTRGGEISYHVAEEDIKSAQAYY